MKRFPHRALLSFLAMLLTCAFAHADPIRVVVWDEQQPQQKTVYENFLGNWIADYLRSRPGFSVTSVRLDDPEQGLSKAVLDNCDVLIWWGHLRHRDVKPAKAREIVECIKAGKLNLIALHSAHWSTPFVEAMNERAQHDALQKLPAAERATARMQLVHPKPFTLPRYDDALTPAVRYRKKPDGPVDVTLTLPLCVFPAYRADGKPSQVTTLRPEHPIAAGIPARFTISHTEMYDEPFHVPEPDAVVFEEHWAPGEWFRSGCVWRVGKGRVFYFRPGHEIYPVYKEPIPLRILENAARWLGSRTRLAADQGARKAVELSLQTRDQAGKPIQTLEKVHPAHVGIVVVDMWNYHWCKTAAMRVAALVPRMNLALDAARKLGMTVMLCPSDVVDNYAGWRQREIIFALPKHPVPALARIDCPPAPDPGGCACGRKRCVVNYGWDAMNPNLGIADTDLMPDTLQDVYSICKERGLTHLIYMGVHTQVCLLGKPMGLRNLKAAGLRCILARDLTDAHPGYDPATGLTPESNTATVVQHFERYLAPSINLGDELDRNGLWDRSAVVDPVRITPWGTAMRPHLFEEDVLVTLSTPLQPGATICYTLDGSKPTTASPRYEKLLKLTKTSQLRAAAFDGGRWVCRESSGSFVRLEALPPMPDVHLSDLTALRAVGPGHTYGEHMRFSAHSQPPQKDRSNEGAALRLHGVSYARGMGVHAPNQLQYEVKPEYERFVALAGVDEHLLEAANGSNRAMYPSVVFKVFFDGREAATSPVMRIAVLPWRFDVPIPRGTKIISLAVTDAGDGNKEDRANWVNAGFVRKR
jgi:trehalose utilization protein